MEFKPSQALISLTSSIFILSYEIMVHNYTVCYKISPNAINQFYHCGSLVCAFPLIPPLLLFYLPQCNHLSCIRMGQDTGQVPGQVKYFS